MSQQTERDRVGDISVHDAAYHKQERFNSFMTYFQTASALKRRMNESPEASLVTVGAGPSRSMVQDAPNQSHACLMQMASLKDLIDAVAIELIEPIHY